MKENIKSCIPLIMCLCIIFLFLFLNTHNFDKKTLVDNSGVLNNEKSICDAKIINIDNYNDLKNIINTSTVNYIVFGKTNCPYCADYLKVLNNISCDYNIKFYYINMLSISADESSKIRNSDILIPSKCAKSGLEEHLNVAFGTPLSLLIKNNETVDCLNGYNNYDTVKNILKYNNLLK